MGCGLLLILLAYVWFMPWWSVGWSWMWPTEISGSTTWRGLVFGWLVMWLVQCVMVRSVAVSSVSWARSSWVAPMVAASILVLWSRVAFMQIVMTQASMSSVVQSWSGSALPASIFTVVPWTQSGMVTFVLFVMCHWGSGRRYSVWTVHDNMTILVAFIAPNVRAMLCDMSWFLTLETAILFIWHHINCREWDNCCHEMLYGIKLLHFRDDISKCLRSFFIDACCQTMGILNPFTKILMVAVSFVKLHLFATVLNLWM